MKNFDVRLKVDKELKLHSTENMDLIYLELDKKQVSDVIFKSIKHTLLKKIILLQGVELFSRDNK